VKRTKTQTSKKEGKESKNPDTTGTIAEAIPEYLWRECKRNKNDGETQMWERGERKKSIGREERKKGAECATRREKTMTHVEWM
jgi:hypothetical protein